MCERSMYVKENLCVCERSMYVKGEYVCVRKYYERSSMYVKGIYVCVREVCM